MYRKLIVETLNPDFRQATCIVNAVLPVPRETQVLVRLCYAGVNASDVNFSAGRYLPGVQPPLECGFEGVGVVEVAGSKATEAGFGKGSAVAVVKYGCFAEYILVDLHHKPTKLAPSCTVYRIKSAAAEVLPLLVGGLTSSIGLEKAGDLSTGEVVLVTGAAGGTGAFAVQLAALAGNRVIGTCSSEDKVAALKSLGCERAINRKSEDIEAVLKAEYPAGIDLVFEGVGGDMLEICKRCLKPTTGRLVVHGYTSQYTKQDSMKSDEAKLVHLRGKDTIRGFLLKDYPHLHQQHLKKLQDLVEEGKLQPLCDKVEFASLEQVADAVEHLHGAKNIGKVLVTLSSNHTALAGLGPLGAKLGDAVEVSGLTSEDGQKLNGQRGVIMGFLEDKERYAVRFVPENVVNLRPGNLRIVEDVEKVQVLQGEALALLQTPEAKHQLSVLRAECDDPGKFDRLKGERVDGLASCCERLGVDLVWLMQMSQTYGYSNEDLKQGHQHLEALLDYGSYEGPSNLDDKGKLKGLLEGILGILTSDPVKTQLAQLREACSNKADFERAKAESVYIHLGPAYARYGVDWGWQEVTMKALRPHDQEIDDLCKLVDSTLAFSIGGPLALEKNDYVEIFGLESESGQKLNGEKAFAQSYAEDKERYLVLLPPDELKHLRPENLRRVDDVDKLRAILGQVMVRLGTPQAKGELDELRKTCESKDHFEAAKADKLPKLLERIFHRYSIDLGWLFGMLTQHSKEDEGFARNKLELDQLLSFGMGPSDLAKGDCVEVEGVAAAGGPKPLEGRRGFVSNWLEEKGCYAVKFPPDNYLVDLEPKFLKKITDKDKVDNIMLRALTTCRQAKHDMKDLRAKCTDKANFEQLRGDLLQSLIGGTCGRYNVDLGWFFAMVEHLSGEDSALAEQRAELNQLLAFDTGPLGLDKNECLVAEGLESHLNGKIGFMQSFGEQMPGRYAVLFPPDTAVNLKPENLRRCTDREKLLSFQDQAIGVLRKPEGQAALNDLRNCCSKREHFEAARGEKIASLLGSVSTQFGMDLGWYGAVVMEHAAADEEVAQKAKEFDELISWGTIGPLAFEKGITCIEVHGLESEAGKAMNGQKGLVTKWVPEKDRYEVQLGPEKAATLKPSNLRKLDDRERLLCLQRALVEVMNSKEVAAPINKLRREATTSLHFSRAVAKFMGTAMHPIFERYGVDAGWQQVMLSIHGADEEIKAATQQLEELTSWGTVGPDKWERGCYLEVHGLTSDTGQKMNGMAVFLRGYDDARERYDISPADDLSQTKALQGKNLRLIPERHFTGIEEATEFQAALTEAYTAPEAKSMLDQLKSTCPNMQFYLTALKPRLLEFQKPVLERFGFRPDFVGQQHMQRALGPYEADPEFLRRNIETEQLLGLPARS